MTSRAVVLMLTVIILLFEVDLLAHRRESSSTVKKVYAVIALPLLVGFVLVVAKRWQNFR
jgi:hypothetical protein